VHGDARHLQTFLWEYGDPGRRASLFHDDEVFRLVRGVIAAPWWMVV
jgi:hypothetical protein